MLLLAGFLWLSRPFSQPRVAGRNLDAWVLQLYNDYPQLDHEAVAALQAMGEPAVRQLARRVAANDSKLATAMLQYAEQFPVLGKIFPSHYWDRYMAAKALGEIGTNAAAAIPALQQMQADTNRHLTRVASAALVLIRNESITELARTCVDHANTNSTKAFGILLELGPHATGAVPIILNELQSTNEHVRLRASILLGNVAFALPEGVSIFTNLLSDTNKLICAQAIAGLANCGARAKPVTPLVTRFLDDADANCQSGALAFLWTVFSPAELEQFRDKAQTMTASTNETTRLWAEKLIREMPASR